MKSFSFIFLLLIVLLGFVLRFYQLGDVPVGFHRDEAFFGYNAYSILKTGSEMAGNLFPLHLQSLLYSPAGYSYLSIPFIWVFGLNEFAVRFVAALFGSTTIVLAYFLVKELFGEKVASRKFSESLALLSALFLAISPWHINLSRASAENVLVVFFVTLGVLLYLQWVRKEYLWLLLLSFLAFSITLLLYQAPRAFLPLFIPFLFLCFHPKVWKKHLVTQSVLFILLIIIPVVSILSSHSLTQRIRMLSIFQNPATQLVLDEQIREDQGNNVTATRFFHNKAVNYSVTFFSNYFSHFSYDFLMLDKGFPDRYRVPQMGLLYFFELPLLIFGLWKLLGFDKKRALFLGGWILLAPLGSALTYDDIPNLQRTLIVFPALAIVIAYGFLELWSLTYKLKTARIVQGALVIVMFYGFVYYLHQYYIHQVNHQPWRRQEGYKQLVAQLNDIHAGYKKVVVTDSESDPAIFFLFHNQSDPAAIQEQLRLHPTERYGQIPLENYVFVKEPCPLHVIPQAGVLETEQKLSAEKDVLYVNGGNCNVKDPRIRILSEIRRSDGTVVFTLQTMKQ